MIIVGLLLLLFLDKCNSNPLGPDVTTEIESDTSRVTVIDTIPFTEFHMIDSIRWHDLPRISASANQDSSEFTYETQMKDSLIDGTITSVVKADGTLVTQDFRYIPLFPKYITIKDSVTITNTITNTVHEADWGIYGGLDIAPYKNFALIPNIGIKTKKDMFFGVGYDPFNENIHIQFKMKIFGK